METTAAGVLNPFFPSVHYSRLDLTSRTIKSVNISVKHVIRLQIRRLAYGTALLSTLEEGKRANV